MICVSVTPATELITGLALRILAAVQKDSGNRQK